VEGLQGQGGGDGGGAASPVETARQKRGRRKERERRKRLTFKSPNFRRLAHATKNKVIFGGYRK
jgi:hypothetical protein